MELHEIRAGNYVKEHEFSSRGRSLEGEYAIELYDIAYYNFMCPVPITKEWCEKLGFVIEVRHHSSSNYDWVAMKGAFTIKILDDEIIVLFSVGGVTTLLENIKNVHELQNFYYFWHLKELTIAE